jgi:hypothetical protein
MASAAAQLLATEATVAKLGARGISTNEAQQVPRNPHVIDRNPRDPHGARRLLIGRRNGRTLTLVIEQRID